MANNPAGAKKAAKTNRQRHGADFYARIGAKGGKKSKKGGFASKVVGKDGLTGQERARLAGARGGKISRRSKSKQSV